MKKETLDVIKLMVLLTGLFASGLAIGYNEAKQQMKYEQSINKTPKIVWNDDIEGLPKDGKTIKIQKTINDTIYIGNVD